jgi:phage/plasmid-like protein (TIGR03299 family)
MRVLFTPTRVVCQNTLAMALTTADRRNATGWSFEHTGDLDRKIAEARQILGLAAGEMDAFGDGARTLARSEWSEAQLRHYFNRLYPDPVGDDPKVEARRVEQSGHRDRLRELFDTGVGLDMPGVRGTGWAAYNAVSEHLDHDRPHRTRNRRSVTQFEHSVFGAGRGMKARAFSLALEMAAN